jgi:hypothetical protein
MLKKCFVELHIFVDIDIKIGILVVYMTVRV